MPRSSSTANPTANSMKTLLFKAICFEITTCNASYANSGGAALALMIVL